jgi:hypothetical protein
VDTQSVEFWVIEDEAEFTSQSWDIFEVRFNRSARSVGFSTSIADDLQVALHAMVENAVIRCWVQRPRAGSFQAEWPEVQGVLQGREVYLQVLAYPPEGKEPDLKVDATRKPS